MEEDVKKGRGTYRVIACSKTREKGPITLGNKPRKDALGKRRSTRGKNPG